MDLLGAEDINHLRNAAKQGRILCTYDSDFLDLVSSDMLHAGLVFGQQDIHYIGDWVNWLSLMHAVYTPEEMLNRVEYM